MWSRHSAEWRDSAQICSQWREAESLDPGLLECKVSRGWWNWFLPLGLTLLVTREYEHLVMAFSGVDGRPRISYFPVPHPSGMVVDRDAARVYLASTRNPNQIYTLGLQGKWLTPVASDYYPGSMYFHDLALIQGRLHANAVGRNSVVRLHPGGKYEPVWWPKSVEDFSRNYIQLNSIAAGKSLRDSFFSASSERPGRLRPGHLNYPVDGRGVIFSGRTREPFCRGLTRPHSARLSDGQVWVANSGYGEIGVVADGKLEVVARLPGWTRGLCIVDDIVFVSTSRVIPRYARYAPGLDPARSRCGIHAVARHSGKVLGSLEWPMGNQVFAIEWMASAECTGFVFDAGKRRREIEMEFFFRGASGEPLREK